jgi:Caspase domain
MTRPPAPSADQPALDRRATLALLAATALSPQVLAQSPPKATLTPTPGTALPLDVVTVLYRPDSPTACTRLDPAVRTATRMLEADLLKRGLRVVQPSPDTYAAMDAGPGVIVTFAPDAGLSLVFSANKSLRPTPGVEAGTAEVMLEARVFVGRAILAAESARGQAYTRLEAGVREYGERRASEIAAGKAATQLAGLLNSQLKSLSPERLQSLVGYDASSIGMATAVEVPATPAPPPTSVAPTPVPGPAPSPAPAPAASPPPAASPATPGSPPATVLPPLPVGGRRFALVVGVSDYGPIRQAHGIPPDNLKNLPGVMADVRNIQQTLEGAGYAGNITPLVNQQASSLNVRHLLKQYATQLRPEDTFVLFMSAHGSGRNEGVSGYGMPILGDYNPRQQQAALDFWELQSLTLNLPCQRVIWLIDTCHSGGAAQNLVTVDIGRQGVRASTGITGPEALTVSRTMGKADRHFALITASRPDEVSWETNGQGVFTRNLTQALSQSDNRATLEEVFKQIHPRVIAESLDICRRTQCPAPQQTPVMAFTGRGNELRL